MPGELSVSLNAHEVGVLLSHFNYCLPVRSMTLLVTMVVLHTYDRLNEVFSTHQEQLELKYEPYIAFLRLNKSVVYTIMKAVLLFEPVLPLSSSGCRCPVC